MTPAVLFLQLTPERQKQVHFSLCEEALKVWEVYSKKRPRIRSVDTVLGRGHKVDIRLPHDALRSAKAGTDLADVEERYSEPIVAMQDSDLEFPRPIEFAYYAIYNGFCKYVLAEKIDPWLIVNQALSCNDGPTSWAPRLLAAIDATR